MVLLVSGGLKKTYGFQKKVFVLLSLLLASGLMLLLGPEVLLAQKKAQSTDQFQRLELPQTANKLIGIEPVSMADMLTIHLNFDGKLPLHNAFILSNPPRFVIEFIDAG